MPSEVSHSPITLMWKDLHAAKFEFDTPFNLSLIEGETIAVERVVRIIPKRRLVAYAMWQGKPVVAKLFFDTQHAQRHIEKEVKGVKLLQDNKIPTPALYYQGKSADKRTHVLLFERIFDAQNLEEIWQSKVSMDEILPRLQSVIIELATQHVLGVLQHDMHLKNFLLTEKKIYTLDGAQIEPFPYLLPKKPSMNNLALFLSQLGVGVEAFQESLFKHYAKARGWLLKPEDTQELFHTIKKYNEERWQRYEKKIMRNCTDFVCMQDIRHFGMYARRYATPELLALFHDPEIAFNHPNAKVLKAGRSSTVVKLQLDNKEIVVKRYNMKSFWHHLRRALRPTRAATSWRLAQKLNLFGIKTAKPIAFIEKRYIGLRGKAYYITEYIAGDHAGEFFNKHLSKPEKMNGMVKQLVHLLQSIAKLEVTHGDLKITNILVNSNEHPVLIDLDGTVEHASISSLRKTWHKEMKRFLANFTKQPIVLDKFKAELDSDT